MKFFGRLKSDLIVSLFRTLIARGVAALGGILLLSVLGRQFGPAGVGVFALAQSVYFGAGLLSQSGMNKTLVRFVGANRHSTAVRTYLSWALRRVLRLSLIATGLVYLLRTQIARWFGAPELVEVLPGISLAIPAFSIAFVFAGFMKGIRRPATASLLENGCIELVAAGVFVFLRVVSDHGISDAGWAMGIAAWFVLAQGIWQLWRWFCFQKFEKGEVVSRHEFSASGRAFFVIGLAQFMQQTVSVMIAGSLLSSTDLGLFRASARAALLINFILIVINAVIPARFATLYHQGDRAGLNVLARKGTLLGIVLASPIMLVCVVVPQMVLSLFGHDFVQGANLLRIIAIAQMVNVATGSVSFLLNMTGHERLMRNISITTNLIGLLSFVALIPIFGVYGAAAALTLVLILQNLTALVFVWRKLGIWTLPIPNVLVWLQIEGRSDKRKGCNVIL
jgi:O-antigen/teichoic acid export membrane protein